MRSLAPYTGAKLRGSRRGRAHNSTSARSPARSSAKALHEAPHEALQSPAQSLHIALQKLYLKLCSKPYMELKSSTNTQH